MNLEIKLILLPLLFWIISFLIILNNFLKSSKYNKKFNIIISFLYFWLLEITSIFNLIVYYFIKEKYLDSITNYDLNIYLFLLYITIIYILLIITITFKYITNKKYKLENILLISFILIFISSILNLVWTILILSK